ncbi:hypothetical protein [Nocardiopsis algeriensis]|uniref:Uncharacterized protein n=1 Tax=Nocardiopsis algeriensis TaxID=1478215 RepID=A0A841IU37_9ACTN|nr:hypothetical protein [Nocardiopsis algeriensis]MBB6122183.1 hypothetical protein [Nocardiopsis algeriensis]
MSAAKKPSPPDMSGLKDDWNRMSGLRRAEKTGEAAPPPVPPKPARQAKQQPAKPVEQPMMSRRSWYAEQDAVEALAAAVDEVHFATRVPKHTIVSELFRVAAAAAPKVEKKLKK